MSRIQAWLEGFLTPLSKLYGSFEYTKDSTDILRDFSNLNHVAEDEAWNFDDLVLFGIDVQALYPSIKFEYLELAICNCLDTCTNWSIQVKAVLLYIIIYTLENQQILWDGKYYLLDQGIPTGGKHCVPLANIFLSYILRDLLKNNQTFRVEFETKMKLWKRYIDDCGGAFLGRVEFGYFFTTLSEQFKKFGLLLTYVTSQKQITLLDIEVFVDNKQLHTREHRKETACNSYVKFGSAHPKHCFKGIVKSQMYRLRRLCSRDSDFLLAIGNLRQRCLNSGYDMDMVNGILSQASSLDRVLAPRARNNDSDTHVIRWVVLSGSAYEKQIQNFTGRMNRTLQNHNIRLELVKSTGASIAKMLFNNNVKYHNQHSCNNCDVCSKNLRGDVGEVLSPTNGRSYPLDKNLNCGNCGIYCVCCTCLALYTGKTTTYYSNRFDEHFTSPGSAVFEHMKHCQVGKNKEDYRIQFLENMYSRGKFSLSEREYLWNERLRGIINIQKTLRS